jgi:archaellum component FlaF (FlaF/FlaG flagellin family)
MIRNIKILGLALVAVLAMSAVAVGSASAGEFTGSSYPAEGEGGQTTPHKFTVQGQAVECSTASFSGSLAAASEQIKITPVYEGCKAFGFLSATVDMNGCYYTFTADGEKTGTHTRHGSVHIICPGATKSITVTASTCTVHIPEQTPTGNKVKFDNITNGLGVVIGVLVTSEVTGIHSNPTSGFLCPLTEKATDVSGVYTGSSEFLGKGGVTTSVD